MEYTSKERGRRAFVTQGLYSIVIEGTFLIFLRVVEWMIAEPL